MCYVARVGTMPCVHTYVHLHFADPCSIFYPSYWLQYVTRVTPQSHRSMDQVPINAITRAELEEESAIGKADHACASVCIIIGLGLGLGARPLGQI